MNNNTPHAGPFPLRITKNDDHFVIITNHETHYAKTFDPSAARLISAAPDLLSTLQSIVSDYDALMRSQGAKANLGSDFTAADWIGSRLGGHIAKAKNVISKAKGEA